VRRARKPVDSPAQGHSPVEPHNEPSDQALNAAGSRVSPAEKRLPSQDGKHLRNALENHLRAVPGRETQVTLKRPIKTC
jgi:hypothetical protein